MKLPDFEYRAPTELSEAIKLLADSDGAARPLAGGQSLLPVMAFRLSQPSMLVDLHRIPGLDQIQISDAGLRIGALVTWRKLLDSKEVAQACPLLSAALDHVAHYQIRNRGTIGGSIAHADPAAEMPTIALTCEARIEVVGASGQRFIDAVDLFTGPLMTCLESDEIIVAVHIPAWPAGRRWAFEEFSRRKGDFALAGVALFYDEDESGAVLDAHIGAIGVADTPIRLSAAEAALNGKRIGAETIEAAGSAASQHVDPSPDLHASPAYRKALVGTLLQRALERASRTN